MKLFNLSKSRKHQNESDHQADGIEHDSTFKREYRNDIQAFNILPTGHLAVAFKDVSIIEIWDTENETIEKLGNVDQYNTQMKNRPADTLKDKIKCALKDEIRDFSFQDPSPEQTPLLAKRTSTERFKSHLLAYRPLLKISPMLQVLEIPYYAYDAYQTRYGLSWRGCKDIPFLANNFLASVIDNEIHIYNIAKTSSISCIKEDCKAIYSLVVSEDGKLISASSTGLVKLWDINTHQFGFSWKNNDQPIYALSSWGNSKLVACGSYDHNVYLLDPTLPQASNPVDTLKNHKNRIVDLAVLPNCHQLASVSDDGEIQRWDQRMLGPLPYGEFTCVDNKAAKNSKKKAIAITALPDDRLAISTRGVIRLWNRDEKEKDCVFHVEGNQITPFIAIPNGRLAYSQSGLIKLLKYEGKNDDLEQVQVASIDDSDNDFPIEAAPQYEPNEPLKNAPVLDASINDADKLNEINKQLENANKKIDDLQKAQEEATAQQNAKKEKENKRYEQIEKQVEDLKNKIDDLESSQNDDYSQIEACLKDFDTKITPLIVQHGTHEQVVEERKEIESYPSAQAFYQKLEIRLSALLCSDTLIESGKIQQTLTVKQQIVGMVVEQIPKVGKVVHAGVDFIQDKTRSKRHQRIEERVGSIQSCIVFSEFVARNATLHFIKLKHFSANESDLIPGLNIRDATKLGECAAHKMHHYLKQKQDESSDESSKETTVQQLAEKMIAQLGNLQTLLSWAEKSMKKIRNKILKDPDAHLTPSANMHFDQVSVTKTEKPHPNITQVNALTKDSQEQKTRSLFFKQRMSQLEDELQNEKSQRLKLEFTVNILQYQMKQLASPESSSSRSNTM